MKIICVVWILAIIFPFSFTLAEEEPDSGLIVHEWGTFTTFHSPNNQSIRWYLSSPATDPLPSFVKPSVGTKAGYFSIRMETPVLYFYTDRVRKAAVKASMAAGNVTEMYPRASFRNLEFFSTELMAPRLEMTWDVELIPPDASAATSLQLPPDAAKADNHYFFARDVPEAAFVIAPGPTGKEEAEKQVEKFIFYRGASQAHIGSPALLGAGGEVTPIVDEAKSGPLWFVENKKGQLSWKGLGSAMGQAGTDPKSAELQLSQSIHRELLNSGLSPAEATAMIRTWESHWFREEGQRVFSLMKREMIDLLVPLEITPKPASLVRVFVHRAELLSPDTMSNLERAMAPDMTREATRQLINEQHLGKFTIPALGETARIMGERIAREYQGRAMDALKE